MSVKTRTVTIHQHFIEVDGTEYMTSLQPDEYMTPVLTDLGEGKVELRYASRDDYHPYSPVEDHEGLVFEEFTSEDARNDFAAARQAEGMHVFFVNHFEHSMSSYSVIDPEVMSLGFRCSHCEKELDEHGVDKVEGNSVCHYYTFRNGYYVTDDVDPEHIDSYAADHELEPVTINKGYRGGWDDRPSCVLALDSDFTDPLKAAEAIMAEYTAWCGGEVYTLVRETYEAGESKDYDCCGGFIGDEYAQAILNLDEF